MLVYDDPPASGRPGPAEPVRDGYRLSVGGAFSALRRRIVWIFACALVLAGIGLVGGKLLSPRYTAEAQIYIDPRDLNLVSRELTTGGQDSNAYQSVVESQTRLITSSSVLRRVVDATGLTRDDEFTAASGGMVSKVVAALGFGSQDAPSDDEGDANAAVGLLQQRISVRRTGRTYVIDVSVWARDAAKAARLANAVVAAYLAEDAAARTEAANRANSGLTARLGELRTALNAAENRVQAYRAETGLVGTRDALVSDQQLTQINAQLAAARARVVEAQARVEQSQRIARAGLDAGATDDILSSADRGCPAQPIRGPHPASGRAHQRARAAPSFRLLHGQAGRPGTPLHRSGGLPFRAGGADRPGQGARHRIGPGEELRSGQGPNGRSRPGVDPPA